MLLFLPEVRVVDVDDFSAVDDPGEYGFGEDGIGDELYQSLGSNWLVMRVDAIFSRADSAVGMTAAVASLTGVVRKSSMTSKVIVFHHLPKRLQARCRCRRQRGYA